MKLNLTIDPAMIHEQIVFLRGALTGRTLSERNRFLIIDLLRVLSALKAASESEIPEAAE